MLESVQELADCERYHCRPSELDEEDYHTLQRHRAIEAAERRYQAMERKSQAQKANRR